jgi:hypothetical protein
MSDSKDIKDINDDAESKGLVTLDITQIIAFESHLRNSLAAGTAILLTENNVKLKTSSPAKTQADVSKVANISDGLRQHLVAEGIISSEDNERLRTQTRLNALVTMNKQV